MAGLVPYRRANTSLMRPGAVFEDFSNMLDAFFGEGLRPSRSLLGDTFKIDVQEKDDAYLVEAEMPGIKKEEVDLRIEGDALCIRVSRSEEENKDGKNYVHRERRVSSMTRSLRLADADLQGITAKLEEGVLTVSVPKVDKADGGHRIAIE